MEYDKIIAKAKEIFLNLTKAQKISLAIILVIILLVAVYIVNPKKKLVEMRNSQRRSDVVNILNAVYKFSEDGGNISFLTATPTGICRQQAASCEGLVDLSLVINKESKVLSEIPTDPASKDPNSTGYQIWKSASGRINISAPLAENRAMITLSK